MHDECKKKLEEQVTQKWSKLVTKLVTK